MRDRPGFFKTLRRGVAFGLSAAPVVRPAVVPIGLSDPQLALGVALGLVALILVRRARRKALIGRERRAWMCRLGKLGAAHAKIPPSMLWPKGDYAALVGIPDEYWLPWRGPVRPPAYAPTRKGRRAERKAYRYRRRLAGLPIIPAVYTVVTLGARVDMRAWRRDADALLGYDSAWSYRRNDGFIVGEPRALPDRIPAPDFATADPIRVRLGIDDNGEIVEHDLMRDPHGKWAGKTRAGKTNELRLYALHAIRTGHQALVIIDPEDTEFSEFRGLDALPWEPAECFGVTVASMGEQGLGDDGEPVDAFAEDGDDPDLARWNAYAFRPILRTLEAVESERVGRQLEAREAGLDLDDPDLALDARLFADRWVTVIIDESADLFDPEPVPSGRPMPNEPPDIRAARRRNLDRARIARLTTLLNRRSGKRGMSLVLGAQSLRVEALGGGSANVNFGFAGVIGPSTARELRIAFDDEIPESPPPEPGRVIARDLRSDFDPADPFRRFKGFVSDRVRTLTELAPYRQAVEPEREAEPA